MPGLPWVQQTVQAVQCEQQDNWHWKQGQEYNWRSWQDIHRVGEPEAPLDGGSQWPPDSMWYWVTVVLSGVGSGGRLGGSGRFTREH